MRTRQYILWITLFLIAPMTLSARSIREWYSDSIPAIDISHLRLDSLEWHIGAKTVISSGKFAPFWFQSNQWDGISCRPYSGTIEAGIERNMALQPADYTFRRGQKLFDYGFGVNLIGQLSDKSRFVPQEYYATCRFWLVDFTVGARRETFTNEVSGAEKYLGMGGLLWSANAQPIPRITIGISQYRSFPYTKGYLQIKAAMTHGWFIDNTYVRGAMLHHKYAGVRIGGDWHIAVSAEVHHVAQWGGRLPQYGKLGNSWSDFKNIFRGKQGGVPKMEQINAEGNHIVSQQLALDIQGTGWKIHCYYQQINEDNPVHIFYKTMNRYDGLIGISMNQGIWPYINSVTLEALNTTDQSGPVHDIDGIVFGGADNYFQNGVYRSGWSFYERTIGTPMISSPLYNNSDTDEWHRHQTTNNRVFALHGAIGGDIKGVDYIIKVTHARNFDAKGGHLKSHNTALLLQAEKKVAFHPGKITLPIIFGAAFSADIGNQFGNQFGVMLSAKYCGVINLRTKHKKER